MNSEIFIHLKMLRNVAKWSYFKTNTIFVKSVTIDTLKMHTQSELVYCLKLLLGKFFNQTSENEL